MTHDEYVAFIRERYADLFDPSNTDQEWRYLITIGRGWWPLLTDFCTQLEGVLRHHGEVGKWYVRQVKEKMGELRIHVRASSHQRPDNDDLGWIDDVRPTEPSAIQEVISLIREAIVERANGTCEECGEPGGLRVIDGWYKTCCDQHFVEWQEQRTSR